MIRNLNNINPIIKLDGTNLMYKIVPLNSELSVWLKTIINTDVYESVLECALNSEKVSEYQYKITANATGFYRVRLKLVHKNKEKTIQKNSQDLLIVVVQTIT